MRSNCAVRSDEAIHTLLGLLRFARNDGEGASLAPKLYPVSRMLSTLRKLIAAASGDIVADPGQPAVLEQQLREVGRERGAQNAAEIVGARGAGIGDAGREQLRQQRAERREGQAHHAEREAQEDAASPVAPPPSSARQREADDSAASALADEQHRAAAEAVRERGRQRRRQRHEQHGDAEHRRGNRCAGYAACVDAVAQREHRRDVEQRVADDDRERALQQRPPMVAQHLEQRHSRRARCARARRGRPASR